MTRKNEGNQRPEVPIQLSSHIIHTSHTKWLIAGITSYINIVINTYIHMQHRCILMTLSFTSQTLLVFSNKNHRRISLYKKHNKHNFSRWVLLSPAMWSALWWQICIYNKWTMLVRLAIDQSMYLENISVFSPFPRITAAEE